MIISRSFAPHFFNHFLASRSRNSCGKFSFFGIFFLYIWVFMWEEFFFDPGKGFCGGLFEIIWNPTSWNYVSKSTSLDEKRLKRKFEIERNFNPNIEWRNEDRVTGIEKNRAFARSFKYMYMDFIFFSGNMLKKLLQSKFSEFLGHSLILYSISKSAI